MADATRLSVMSKQIEDNKQATDDLRAQMVDFRKSLSHMDAKLSMLVSQSKGQNSHAPVLHASPSDILNTYPRPPQPPDPPDLVKLFESPLLHTPAAIHPRAPFSPNQNQNNQGLTDEIVFDRDNTVWLLNGVVTQQSKIEFEVESIEIGSSIQQIESSGVKDVISTDLVLNNKSNPEEESRPEESSTHKADSIFGEETNTSNASESSQVSLYHLPVFDGTLLDCWIAKVDKFFELKQYGNEEELDLISLSLEGAALKWFKRHRREFTDWTYTKRKLMARFGLVNEAIREIGPIQEHESLGLTDSVLEVDCVHSQEFSSQFQVPIPSLEPSHRHHKESLVVVNDLSYDHGCVIGKTIGSIGDSELGQDNSHDEEEFIGLNLGKLLKNERLFSIICLLGLNDMSCWTQLLRQQLFPKSWRFKFKRVSRESKLLDNNFSGNIKLIEQSSSRDNQFIRTQLSSLVKASEMSLLGRDKWKWSEKQKWYNKAWKFKYRQRLIMLNVLLQREQRKLLQGKTIKCKMRKKEVLRRIKQSFFIEVQLHMKNNSEFNFQVNTRVLELIKGRASREGKLYKNWWFKYKLNTWLSETLHLWRKRESEKLQIFGRATHGLVLKQSFSQVLLHIQNRDYSFFGYMLVATSLVETENIYSFSIKDTHTEGEIMGFKLLLTSGFNWKKFIEWSLFLQMLQTVKDRKNTKGVTIQVMVQRQWETFVMMLLTIAESLILLSDQFIFAENKGIEISISCCYGTSSVDMQFSTSFEIMSKKQHFIQLPNLPWESSHADADGILLKMEVLITPSTQNKVVTKALTQWKEHPPDQFYMALNGRNSISHS